MRLRANDSPAAEVTEAIHLGNIRRLAELLGEHPGLGSARLEDPPCSYSLLHVATDWPGHFPNVAATIGLLVDAGADVNARYAGPHQETPLHWAASSDDIEALDALLDLGADINAPGAVIAGGSPLEDARAFAQWRAAWRLVDRGAETTLRDEATLGLMDRLIDRFERGHEQPDADEVNRGFWGSCHGGQLEAARLLLDHGANINWIPPWENLTPLDAAHRSHRDNGIDATEVIDWLRAHGAQSA